MSVSLLLTLLSLYASSHVPAQPFTWCTDMAASSIKPITRIAALRMLVFGNCGNTPRLDGQTSGHCNQIGPVVLVSTVDFIGVDVSPVNVLAIDSQAKGMKCRAHDDFPVSAGESTTLYLLPETKRKKSNY